MMIRILMQSLILAATILANGLAMAQDSAITYQGQLRQSGQPYSGTADLEFRLYDQLAGGEGPRMGFIAQEVESVFPQWVGEDVDGYKFINTTGFEALLVEALRQLKQQQEHADDLVRQQVARQIERLDQLDETLVANQALNERNAALESRLAALEQILAAGLPQTGDQP